MAITTTTITKAAGWARTDVIIQLEEAFAWLGWHGATHTGIAQTITSYSGGGSVGVSADIYEDVRPSVTSGVGTQSSFYVQRSGGEIYRIHVNRPGYGYTDGEVLTLSSEDIGGSVNGATDIEIVLGISPESYGTTTTFYDSDVTSGSNYPWGVLRQTIQPGKLYGDTYTAFQAVSDTHFHMFRGSAFHPSDVTYTSGNGNYYPNRFAGENDLDKAFSFTSSVYFDRNNSRMTSYDQFYLQFAGSTNAYELDLNIYRSSIDPNFVVFSYKQPTLSSSYYTTNNKATFILHNFTSSIWDYDEVFLGGTTTIESKLNSYRPYIDFTTECAGSQYIDYQDVAKRTAESGYLGQDTSSADSYKRTSYYSTINEEIGSSTEPGIYHRDADRYGSFNAVIKGIPINLNLVPVPYYIPDDFVLIQFEYGASDANIQQGDTITISASEVYIIIVASYSDQGLTNPSDATKGIAFCARIV